MRPRRGSFLWDVMMATAVSLVIGNSAGVGAGPEQFWGSGCSVPW